MCRVVVSYGSYRDNCTSRVRTGCTWRNIDTDTDGGEKRRKSRSRWAWFFRLIGPGKVYTESAATSHNKIPTARYGRVLRQSTVALIERTGVHIYVYLYVHVQRKKNVQEEAADGKAAVR